MSEPSRRRDAQRNDERILAAAREVFSSVGPDAPVALIAERAGIGVGSLYRRFPGKGDLMRELVLRNIETSGAEAELALSDPDPWAAFERFFHACVDRGLSGAPRPGRDFAVTDDVLAASRAARAQVQALVDRAQAAGELRPDVNVNDVVVLLGGLRELSDAEAVASPALRARMIGVILDGLRVGPPRELPAPPQTWRHIRAIWRPKRDG